MEIIHNYLHFTREKGANFFSEEFLRVVLRLRRSVYNNVRNKTREENEIKSL